MDDIYIAVSPTPRCGPYFDGAEAVPRLKENHGPDLAEGSVNLLTPWSRAYVAADARTRRDRHHESQWQDALELVEVKRELRKSFTDLTKSFAKRFTARTNTHSESIEVSKGYVCKQMRQIHSDIAVTRTKYYDTNNTKDTIIEVKELLVTEVTESLLEVGEPEAIVASAIKTPTTPEHKPQSHRNAFGMYFQTDQGSGIETSTNTPSTVESYYHSSMSARSNGLLGGTPDTLPSTQGCRKTSGYQHEQESPLAKLSSATRKHLPTQRVLPEFKYPTDVNYHFDIAGQGSFDQPLSTSKIRPSSGQKRGSSSQRQSLTSAMEPASLFSGRPTDVSATSTTGWAKPVAIEISTLKSDSKCVSSATIRIKEEPVDVVLGHTLVQNDSDLIKEEHRDSILIGKTEQGFAFGLETTTDGRSVALDTEITERDFFNGLQIYDRITEGDAAATFAADNSRCFATTGKGNRCCRRLEQEKTGFLTHLTERLKRCVRQADLIESVSLANDLAKNSLCKAETWAGHEARRNGIVNRFAREILGLYKNSRHNIGLAAMSKFAALLSGAVHTALPDTIHGFRPWVSSVTAQKDHRSRLLAQARSNCTLDAEKNSGYIYAYRIEGLFGFVKIGYTTREIKARLAEWRSKCGHEPVSMLGSAGRVPYIGRVEQLVHLELNDYRHIQAECKCNVNHQEWFQVTHDHVAAVVGKWSTWAKSIPYDSNGLLKQDQLETLEKLCVITVVPTTGYTASTEHIEKLEKAFSFTDLPVRPRVNVKIETRLCT